MGKVKKFSITRLRNDEWLGFLTHILNRLQGTHAFLCSPQAQAFKESVEQYKRQMTAESIASGQAVIDADRAADQAWSCLNALLKVALLHPDEAHRAAAERLYKHLKKYGNPTQLAYDEEYAKLQKLLDNLEAPECEADLKLTHADDWVKALRERYDNFMKTYQRRIETAAATNPGATKMARVETENRYKSFVDYLEALLVIMPNEEIEKFVAELNTQIDIKKTAFKQRTSSEPVAEKPLELVADEEMNEEKMA